MTKSNGNVKPIANVPDIEAILKNIRGLGYVANGGMAGININCAESGIVSFSGKNRHEFSFICSRLGLVSMGIVSEGYDAQVFMRPDLTKPLPRNYKPGPGIRLDQVTACVNPSRLRPNHEGRYLPRIEDLPILDDASLARICGEVPQGEEEKEEIHIISGRDLMTMDIPKPEYVVSGILPQGYCLMSAKQKQGKSTISKALASLGCVGDSFAKSMYLQPKQGPVFYLSLEENQSMVKHCFSKLLQGRPMPDDLDFTSSHPTSKSAIEKIEDWILQKEQAGKQPRLVVIDILQRIRNDQGRNESSYAHDYKTGKPFQELAGRHPGIAILMLHHNRKSESDDPFDSQSGLRQEIPVLPIHRSM